MLSLGLDWAVRRCSELSRWPQPATTTLCKDPVPVRFSKSGPREVLLGEPSNLFSQLRGCFSPRPELRMRLNRGKWVGFPLIQQDLSLFRARFRD